PGQPMPAPGTVQPGDLSFAPAKKEAADAMARNIAAAPASGQAAVEQSQQVGAMQEAKALSDTQPDAGQVRTVGHKAFAWKNAIWVDTTYTGGDLIYLKLGSDQYLKLVAARPDLAPFLAVGTPLVLVDGDRAYGIDIPGQAETNLPKDATNLPAEPGALPEQQQTPEAQQQQSGRGTPRWPMLAGGGLALSLGVAVLIFLRRPHST
ncbi:MAG TPA: hypothetical protein VD902_21065, partial [Symbiobacteriaceae bacterium]|nr:hypothetical protein [Symbiobacteriaceae bacterium]